MQRLLVIKQMKPLDFTLEEMRDLLEVLERLATPRLSARTRAGLLVRLAAYGDLVEHKLAGLRTKVANAERFAAQLRGPLG